MMRLQIAAWQLGSRTITGSDWLWMELVTSAMGIAKAIVNRRGNNAHNNASDAQDLCYLYREIPMPFVGDRTFMANANLIPTKIRTQHLIIGYFDIETLSRYYPSSLPLCPQFSSSRNRTTLVSKLLRKKLISKGSATRYSRAMWKRAGILIKFDVFNFFTWFAAINRKI